MTEFKKSVVIASENLVIINQLSGVLKQNDYAIVIEKATTESIYKILNRKIEFLILDVDIPNNYHLDLIQLVKQAQPGLPIVVLTSDNSLDTLRRLTQAGVFYCAIKPIEMSEIREVLKAINRSEKKE